MKDVNLVQNLCYDFNHVISTGCIIAYDKDWQYPAITEQHAFKKLKEFNINSREVLYIAFPWATLIDMLDRGKDATYFLSFLDRLKEITCIYDKVITVCQHIRMLKHQDIFDNVGITDVFWSHATKTQKKFGKDGNVIIHSFPLYAVQHQRIGNQNLDILNRKYLYSFVGAQGNQWYLSDTRNLILKFLHHDELAYIKSRDKWHYNDLVYKHQIANDETNHDNKDFESKNLEFRDIIQNSVFALCPSGTGPNSIRLWEALSYDSIPVILSDSHLLPGDLKLWKEAAVICEETEENIQKLPMLLRDLCADPKALRNKQQAVKQLWMIYGVDCFVYDILKFILNYPYDNSRDLKINEFVYKLEMLIKHKVDERMLCLTFISSILLDSQKFLRSLEVSPLIKKHYNKLIESSMSDPLFNDLLLVSQKKGVLQ